MDKKKFEEAYEKYIEARELFEKISWKREVSRINNDLLFKLNRERKSFEILEDIKKKRLEEEKEIELLKEEAMKQRLDIEKQKKDEKRKLAREEFDKKILKGIDKAIGFIESFRYNEGIHLLKKERQKLEKLENLDEIKRIDDIIVNVKNQTNVPIITFESFDDMDNLYRYEGAYKALDKAQISISDEHFMKAISELNEAIYNLNTLMIGDKYIKEIEDKIKTYQEKLGRKHDEESSITKEKEHEADMEIIKTRIAKRREERRKKVLDLLKKNQE